MGDLEAAALLPIALSGTLLAALSYRDAGWSTGRRRTANRGARWARRRERRPPSADSPRSSRGRHAPDWVPDWGSGPRHLAGRMP